MLRSVWQKISGKNDKSNPALADSLSALTRAEMSEKPDGKYAALWSLLARRQFMEVRVEASALSFQTLIMAIDIQRGLLWLDDLFPSPHSLEVGDFITLRHHRDDEQLNFSTPVIAWGSKYGTQGLAVALPDHADYQPRRRHRRVELAGAANLTAKIRPIGHEISYGKVEDISAGGLRLSVPGNLLGQLRHGALLPLCELTLSDELTLRCSARVRSFRFMRAPHRQTQVSIEFIDLPLARQQQLQQYVNNLVYLQQASETVALRSA